MKALLSSVYNVSTMSAANILPRALILLGIALTAVWIAAVTSIPLLLLWSVAENIL
jgi:hypothetical protein